MLRFADLNHDAALLEWARREAPMLLDQHPALAAKHVTRWLGVNRNIYGPEDCRYFSEPRCSVLERQIFLEDGRQEH